MRVWRFALKYSADELMTEFPGGVPLHKSTLIGEVNLKHLENDPFGGLSIHLIPGTLQWVESALYGDCVNQIECFTAVFGVREWWCQVENGKLSPRRHVNCQRV